MLHGMALASGLLAGVVVIIISVSPDGQAARTPASAVLDHDHDHPPPAIAAVPTGAASEDDASAAEPESAEVDHVVKAKDGDTFIKLMLDAGVPADDAHAAIAAMKAVYDPRELRPGQRITMSFRRDGSVADDPLFVGLSFNPTVQRAIRVDREDDGFSAAAVDRALDMRAMRVDGRIDANLYTAVTAAGLTPQIMAQLIKLFSWDVDFQRDIQPGDRFDVMVQTMRAPDGRVAAFGDILYADLVLGGVEHRLYRFDSRRYGPGYYDDKGQSARKALLKTPIDGARLSSGYGMRMHPILGYSRMHRGIDFAAPKGTPIYAAGRGTIKIIGRVHGYGNYIRIQHTDRYATAYGHMSRFARGLHVGTHVKQGDVIGYVGATGEATGPHLHYEVLVDKSQVNPMKVKLPSGYKLAGNELAAFRAATGEIKAHLAALDPVTRISSR
jgi:murein DD-endopeptidase MepM/ murein hydrolase activator NlpD